MSNDDMSNFVIDLEESAVVDNFVKAEKVSETFGPTATFVCEVEDAVYEPNRRYDPTTGKNTGDIYAALYIFVADFYADGDEDLKLEIKPKSLRSLIKGWGLNKPTKGQILEALKGNKVEISTEYYEQFGTYGFVFSPETEKRVVESKKQRVQTV